MLSGERLVRNRFPLFGTRAFPIGVQAQGLKRRAVSSRRASSFMIATLKSLMRGMSAGMLPALAWVAFVILALPAVFVLALIVAALDREDVQEVRREH